ncbi:MAG: SpoIIE family protein phosphatase [Scytonematopsis contorta HA4267-MV1]|nr:SpoIIE family protein phosphatase [Scytonematopsis contorta HA4267-MV1]
MLNRLKYPQKFFLISCVFILPISLLMYLLITEIQSRSDFAKKEIYGNTYLRPLRELREDILQIRLLTNDCLNQKKNLNKINNLTYKIDNKFNYLVKLDKELTAILHTENKFKLTKENWYNLQKIKSQENCNSILQDEKYNLLLKQVYDLKSHIGDTSNLILDPDLDSYYLMDATLLKLPQTQEILGNIQLRTQQIVINQKAIPYDRAELLILLGNLKDSNEQLKRNMEVAFKNNPKGNLRPKLTKQLSSFTSKIDLLTQELESLANTNKPIVTDFYFLNAEDSLKQSFILWDETINELDILLHYRIDGFVKKQFTLSIFVLTILAIVLYLFISFYLGVMQTVSSLSTASKQMIQGTLTEAVALNSRDELAEVVTSFNDIAVALVAANQEVQILNERLKEDNYRMKAELDVTRRLQKMILPQEEELLEISDLDIAGYMESADEVGGDYYDIIHHNGHVKIGIGDVTGHGLESGVLMIMVQTAVRTLLENNETNPKKFLDSLNRTIYSNVQRMQSDKNLTLCLLDYQNKKLRVYGQHEEVIVIRQKGTLERIDTIDLGFPIGLEPDISQLIAYKDIQLNTGDVVVLYTDGITEAEDINGVQYQIEGLSRVLKQNSQKSAKEIRQEVINDLQRHIGKQKVFDDITLVILKQK